MIASLLLVLLLAEQSFQLKFGGRGVRDWKAKHFADTSDDGDRDDCRDKPHKPKPCPPKETEAYDYGFVGGGMGGLNAASYLFESIKDAGQEGQLTGVLFEANAEVGGNIKAAVLQKPEGYDETFGRELYGDEGPQRVTHLTLPLERRDVHRQGLELQWTPFYNEYNLRGRRLRCLTPDEAAAGDGAFNSPDDSDFATNAFAYSDLCMTGNADFTGQPSVTGDNLAECSVYVGLHDNADPSCPGAPGDSVLWLLEGAKFKVIADEPDLGTVSDNCYDADCSLGSGFTHPINCRSCTVGADCPWDLARDPNQPKDDWRTHIARHTSYEVPGRPLLNYNMSAVVAGDNVGFLGDQRRQYGAASYGDYTLREINTNSLNGYIPGGMRRYAHSHLRNATNAGLVVHTSEAVIRVDKLHSGPYKFRVETTKRIALIRSHLFLNLPPYYLQESETATDTPWVGRFLKGTLIDELREVEEFKHPDPQDVVRILAQWAPGVKPWFAELFANTGNHSFRQFGDTGCFSRTEFIDTPYHRCTNHVVPVYTDDECERIWLGYFEEYRRTNDISALKRRVVEEMKTSFPELAHLIDDPVFVHFEYFPSAWHWGKRSYDHIENYQVTSKAAKPLGDWPVSVLGEAYAISWQGWIEAVLRTVKRALWRHADDLDVQGNTALADAIRAKYDTLFDILRNPDGSIADGTFESVFAYQPPLFNSPNTSYTLPTEHWWPYADYASLYAAGPAAVCSADSYGLARVNDQ